MNRERAHELLQSVLSLAAEADKLATSAPGTDEVDRMWELINDMQSDLHALGSVVGGGDNE